jgi:predicted RNase H-like HicB family nuclease
VAKPVVISRDFGDHEHQLSISASQLFSVSAFSNTGIEKMKDTARYVKIVEWSDEDQCYIGSCPGLFYGGCHGADEKEVFKQLCQIVEETIEVYHRESRPLPPSTSGQDLANRLQRSA